MGGGAGLLFIGRGTGKHKLAGLPAVTAELVTQRTRPFLCLVCKGDMTKASELCAGYGAVYRYKSGREHAS